MFGNVWLNFYKLDLYFYINVFTVNSRRKRLSEKRLKYTMQNVCLVHEDSSTRDRDDDSRRNITDTKLLVTINSASPTFVVLWVIIHFLKL